MPKYQSKKPRILFSNMAILFLCEQMETLIMLDVVQFSILIKTCCLLLILKAGTNCGFNDIEKRFGKIGV